MSVSLVWATPDAEKLVVKTARVSNKANEDNWETGPKLLKYLIKHNHWSPFEMVSMCIEINTQRDIASQIERHRSFSFQEFSTRYAKTDEASVPWFRRQDEKNRQNSINDIHPFTQQELQYKAQRLIRQSYDLYEYMLQRGVAKETARRILPLCTPTSMYMTGSLRSWIHYINVRASRETQHEHRLIAQKCLTIFKREFPIIAEAAFSTV